MTNPHKMPAMDLTWMRRAACRGKDLNLWFPKPGGDVITPKAVCEPCPVRLRCLDYALKLPADTTGIWGGLSEHQRRLLRSFGKHPVHFVRLATVEADDWRVTGVAWNTKKAHGLLVPADDPPGAAVWRAVLLPVMVGQTPMEAWMEEVSETGGDGDTTLVSGIDLADTFDTFLEAVAPELAAA